MRRKQALLWFASAALIGSVAAAAWWLDRTGRSSDAAGRPTLEEAIRLASDYLVRQCDERGQFVYKVNLDPNVELQPQYNIVRHAGAVYALAASHRRSPTPEKLAALRRAAGFLRREAIAPVPGQQGVLAVWSRPEIERRNVPIQAKLGGTGLGLVALLSVEQIEPGTVPLDELRGLGRFLVFMQKDDGSFHAKYDPGGRGRDNRWRSLYYPGEAALGLLMLYEEDPQPVWLQTAARAIAYLARMRRGAELVEPDHWALLATARLWPLCDRCTPPFPRETLSRHAIKICRRMLDEPERLDGVTFEPGCLTPDGRTCPTATRVEGLTAALAFLPDSKASLRSEISRAVGEAIDFLLRSQVRQGRYAGGIPRAVGSAGPAGAAPEPRRDAHRRTEVRVDYVQHALSAMIQSEQLERGDVGL